MRISKALIGLSVLIGLLALLAAGTGLFLGGGEGAFTVTSVRGQQVEMFGQGLYRYDTLFGGAGARGQDAVVLLFGVPLLAFSLWYYARGLRRGGLLLLGTLGYFVYTYASTALGAVAYNELFLLYVVLFAASFYGFVLAFTAFDLNDLGKHFSADMPRRGPALFMLVSGLVTLVVWAGPVIAAQLANQIPERLDTYSTLLTVAFDLATITPACFVAGILILQRRALGYLIAFALLVLEVLLFPLIVAQTVFQLLSGVTYPIGQIIGPIMGFVVLALLALWVLLSLLRHVEVPGARPAPHAGRGAATPLGA